ncbi:MAG: GAF domain-containing protein [Anaerolineae bacterium]
MTSTVNRSEYAQDALLLLRVRYIQVIAWGAIIVAPFGFLFELFSQLSRDGEVKITTLVFIASFALLGAGVLVLVTNNRRVLGASGILIVTLIAATLALRMPPYLILGILALVSTAVLGNSYFFVLSLLLVIGKGVINLWEVYESVGQQINSDVNTEIVAILVLLFVSLSIRYFMSTAERTAVTARRGAELLRTTAEVGRVTAGLLNVSELLTRACDLIRDGFAYYHVQTFLTDDTGDAVLVASTGEIGQKLLTEKYRVMMGSRTVVGQTMQIGEPVYTRGTRNETPYTQPPALASTRSELAIPILDGNRILGILDVHSLRRSAFHPNDIQALQIMSNQLGTALRNARLFEAQNKSLQENKRLFLESEARLREMQRLNQQLTKAAWSEYLQERHELTGITLLENAFLPDTQWTDSMVQAAQRRQPITQQNEGKQIITVPIVLRGEVLGAIEIEPDDPIREGDTVEMLKAVAERLATSLENTRLLEQTQAENAQKQRINEIAERFQSITTVDELLRVTVSELSQSLGALHGSIRLGTLNMDGKG